ncbi:MAG: carboxypeptidase-like regulatory domain-containing protein [Winogradskyella sp.]|uniref:carboxypeptidase-like regulatory domain-containing protein n=1 Tax=Winogradskyella sp. TaxID=1883156 RepID=UPI00385E4BAC
MISRIGLLCFLILPLFCVSQTLTGRIIDKATQQPIETVAVYFDNTTIGTTTNEKGEFSITYTDATQSTLVISYLGYEKVFILDYRSKKTLNIELVEAENTLDEVYLDYDDGLTRRQKLRLFRKEFLGSSKFGKSCKILNEDDLFLRYDKKNKTMSASSKAPVMVINKALQYEVAFDIKDFEIKFRYVEPETNIFNIHSIAYFGTSFYKDLKDAKKTKTLKNREAAYNGSVQHFMRALYNKNFEEEGYIFGKNKFKVNWNDFFTIYDTDNLGYKTVVLKEKLDIFYNQDKGSVIETAVDQFQVDQYGNYLPVVAVYFGGVMGTQRIGDLLPSDYGLNEKETTKNPED